MEAQQVLWGCLLEPSWMVQVGVDLELEKQRDLQRLKQGLGLLLYYIYTYISFGPCQCVFWRAS